MAARKSHMIAATALLTLTTLWSVALADRPNFNMDIAYSATRIIEGGEQRMEQRYFQKNATTNRMEMHLHGEHSTVIMNGDRGLMWILMPAQRMYLESGIDDQPFDGANVEMPDPDTWEMQRVGRESVNGIPATKYRVATDGGETTRMRGYLWVSDHGIPVRTDMVTGGDRIQMELRDLVVGPQSAALFEPPADYQRMAFGGGMGQATGGMDAMTAGPSDGTATPGGVYPPGNGPGTGFAGELANEAAEEAKRATKNEVRHTVRDSVRKGLRSVLPGR